MLALDPELLHPVNATGTHTATLSHTAKRDIGKLRMLHQQMATHQVLPRLTVTTSHMTPVICVVRLSRPVPLRWTPKRRSDHAPFHVRRNINGRVCGPGSLSRRRSSAAGSLLDKLGRASR